MASFGSQKSSSNPVDMTPAAFQQLQQPFANVISRLIGAGGTGRAGGPGTIYNDQYGTAGTSGTPGSTSAPVGARQARAPQIGDTGNMTLPSYMLNTQAGRQNANRTNSEWKLTSQSNGRYTYTNVGSGKMVSTNSPLAPTGADGTGTGTPGTPGTLGTNPNDILSGIPYYQGDLVAQMAPEERKLLDLLMKQSTGGTSAGPDAAARNYLLDAIKGKYVPQDMNSAELTKYINPFLNAQIEAAQRPTWQGLTETLDQTLPGRFTQAGQFVNPKGSSAFDRAAALASRDAHQTAADQATDLSFQTYDAERGRQFTRRENERGRQQEAALKLPGITREQINTTIESLKAAALPRMIQDLGIERGIEEFNNRVNNLMTTLGIAAGVTRPVISQESKSSGFNFGLSGK